MAGVVYIWTGGLLGNYLWRNELEMVLDLYGIGLIDRHCLVWFYILTYTLLVLSSFLVVFSLMRVCR
jgi:hypothetical protein